MRNQHLGQAQSGYIEDFFTYAVNSGSIDAAASSVKSITIEADSDFVIQKLSYQADIAGAAQTDSSRVIPLVTIALLDTGSGRNLQNTAIPLGAIAGTGDLPFILPQPKKLVANATLQITFTNYSAATTYANIYLALVGKKRFYL